MLRRNPTCYDFALPKVCAGTGRLLVERVEGKKIKAARCLAVGWVESQGTTMFVAKVHLLP